LQAGNRNFRETFWLRPRSEFMEKQATVRTEVSRD
jgi:hypothetical protein